MDARTLASIHNQSSLCLFHPSPLPTAAVTHSVWLLECLRLRQAELQASGQFVEFDAVVLVDPQDVHQVQKNMFTYAVMIESIGFVANVIATRRKDVPGPGEVIRVRLEMSQPARRMVRWSRCDV